MNNQVLQKWLKAGDTTVSNVLLTYYRQIGLSNEELVLIIQLKAMIDQGVYFPIPNKLQIEWAAQQTKFFKVSMS